MNFELRKIGDDRRGQIGNFVGMFVATIVVVIILLVFIISSALVKTISRNKEGISVRNEEMTGIENIYSYMSDYGELVKKRFDRALTREGVGG